MYEVPNLDRSTSNAPKANTRFLKNIIRETNSHNAALQAKEVEESRARLKSLHHSDGKSPSSRDSDFQINGEDHHRSKRRRTDDEDEKKRHIRRDREGKFSRRHRDEERRSITSYRKDSDDQYTSEANGEDRYHERRHRHRHRHRHHHRSRHRRDDEDELYEYDRRGTTTRKQSGKRYRSRSRSPRSIGNHHQRHHRSQRSVRSSPSAPSDQNGEHGSVSRLKEDSRSTSADDDANIKKRAASLDSDSDPLEAIIGPPPPPPAPKVQARGRGNFSSSSAMDSHFASNYDPSVDVHLDPDMEDDWDQALEAIRDRQRWQKLGAERLKSAGFTEEEVKKWEKGGERTEEDVRWQGQGEGREWDRGKIIGDDGIETRSEWGRLIDG